MHLFSRYLLSSYYVPGTGLGPGYSEKPGRQISALQVLPV